MGVPNGYKGICTPKMLCTEKGRYTSTNQPQKLPKLDLTTNTEYVANLVNINMWLQKGQFITWVCYGPTYIKTTD